MEMTQTSVFLKKWYQGDPKGLDSLMDRHLSWIQGYVRKRMGSLLRKKAETIDFVQDAMVQFLKYGPRIRICDDDHFRALFVRIVENALRDKYDWFTAKRRAISKEKPLHPETILSLDRDRITDLTPSAAADSHEKEAWIRLGLELLSPEDREILVLRQWDNLSFEQIGEQMNLSTDAARMRANRAIGKLGRIVGDFRRGKTPKVMRSVLAED